MPSSLLHRGVAECVGTAFLLAAVVGSGIMAQMSDLSHLIPHSNRVSSNRSLRCRETEF
jgi:hypothetical protein